MRVIRGVGIAIGFLILTAWFVIFQSMALKFNWAMRDWLPIQFARALCRLFAIWGSTLLSLGNCFPADLGGIACWDGGRLANIVQPRLLGIKCYLKLDI